MKVDKFENEFKAKLQEREINPSADSWDRLNALLTVEEGKKPKRNYGWIYIAASIVGFVLIGTVFLSHTEELIDIRRNEIVIKNKETSKPKIEKKEAIPFKVDLQTVALVDDKIEAKINKHEVKPINKFKTTTAENEVKQNAIAEQLIINQKTEQESQLKPDNIQIDEMLESAALKNVKRKADIKVNARSLLAQVDYESELSFREKVINKFDKNYQTIKVAIATRNQEQIINQN